MITGSAMLLLVGLLVTVCYGTTLYGGPDLASCSFVTWQQFQSKVANKFWFVPYVVDFSGTPTQFGRHLDFFTVLNDTSILVRISHWSTEQGPIMCDTHQYILQKAQDTDKAVFQVVIPNKFELTFMILSEDPEQYFINYACFRPLEFGVCPKPTVLVAIRDRRSDTDGDGVPDGEIVLEDIPWCTIEKTLQKCVGKSFTDTEEPRVKWKWHGLDNCPFPEINLP